jgi:hypothetical protein
MTNTLIQKMACGEYVYLTPHKEYVFMGQTFKHLSDCYAYEVKDVVRAPRDNTWIKQMIARCKEIEKSKKV